MVDNAYDAVRSFAADFVKTEYAFKRSGFLREGREVAEPDRRAFASSLGSEFFLSVFDSKVATMLIGEPPRRLH